MMIELLTDQTDFLKSGKIVDAIVHPKGLEAIVFDIPTEGHAFTYMLLPGQWRPAPVVPAEDNDILMPNFDSKEDKTIGDFFGQQMKSITVDFK